MLIAGGGPVGLAAAIELGRRGVNSLIAEPRAVVSHARPRCKTINVRTMEHLRRWGIAERLRSLAPIPPSFSQDVVFCTSLAGHELSRFRGVFGLVAEGDRFPELGQQAPQFVLEELLREVVTEMPQCELALGFSVVALEQRPDHVLVTLHGPGGQEHRVRAEYVLGCDGPRSVVREQIGSRYEGEHALRPNFGMVFRAPGLLDRIAHGPALHYWVINKSAPAILGPLDLDGTWWIIALGVSRAEGERRGREIIAAAAGMPVSAEICSVDPWTARMQLVDRARRGRVFLAGDAAHLNPPWGGHGLNTGIGDAVDIGWKLAAVLDGWGGPGLLDSYETERRPIQKRVIDAAAANMSVLPAELLRPDLDDSGPAGALARREADVHIQQSKRSEFHALDLVLGAAYENSPIVEDGAGGRLEHAWVGQDSIYDLLGDGFTLLGFDGPGSAEPQGQGDGALQRFEQAFDLRGVPLRRIDMGAPLRSRYGARYVLVRPDQHVAWRGEELPTRPGLLVDRVRGMEAAVAAQRKPEMTGGRRG